jgi:hypothetical protein
MIKRIIAGLLLIGALTALCVFVFSNKSEPPQSIQLSDGTIWTFLGVTHGTNHSMAWGKPYQRSLYKLLPAKLKGWSKASVYTFTTSNTNEPVFWLHEAGPVTNAGYPAMRLLDEYGCELDQNGWSMGMSYTPPGSPYIKESISHYQFGVSYPSGRIIGFCIYDSDAKTHRVGRFLIPGSLQASPPEIQQPLSAPKQDGELTIQLLSLATGLKSVPWQYFMLTNGGLFSQARFRVTKNGRPDTAWFPANIKAIDRRGQAIRFGTHALAHKDGDAVFNFEGLLDPANGPFHLQVEFMHRSDYSPEELVTLKGVPFPSMGNSIELRQKAEAQGEEIILERAIGAFPEEVIDTSAQAGTTFFELTMQPPTNAIHVDLIKALDEQGNRLSVNYARVLGKGKYRYGSPPGTKAKSIDLTFAMHKSRFVEFEATPVLFSTNAVQAK